MKPNRCPVCGTELTVNGAATCRYCGHCDQPCPLPSVCTLCARMRTWLGRAA